MKKHRMDLSQRVRYALLAGMAGAFLIPQVAFAAPMGENVVSGGATVTRSGNATNINSSNVNNVIEWRDYSLVYGERVVHDGGAQTNNYLNIVTGANTSNINGKIEGGNHVYIVNPNGVIFGKSAEVNVGHLHVSTQAISTVNTAADMANNVSPLNSSAGLSDVVNMGKDITANTVEVYGKNIRFLNAANVHTTNPVVLHTDTANGGYAHIGYKSGNVPAVTAYQVNGGNAAPADNYYQLVADKTEFQNINSDRTKNYMLENDIDFSGTALTPIGDDTTKFTGKLDGNFFQVKNFNVSGVSRAGLFGATSGARLENFGVVGANIAGNTGASDYAGGIAAYTTGGTQIRNVYVKETTVDGRRGKHGGIVGVTDNTTLDSVYSKATIGYGGGIIGTSAAGTNIYNTYSDARFLSHVPSTQSMFFIYMIDPDDGTYVENSFAVGQFSWNEGNLTGNVSKNTFKIDKSSGQATLVGSGTGGGSMTSVASYSGWGNAINNTGAPGAKWRIYEGRTTPMLTAFMNGTATATYNYLYFKSDGTLKDDTGNAVKSNDGKDITAAYNSYYMKVVDGSTANPTAAGTKANVSFGAGADTSHVIDYVNSSTKDYDRANGIRNAGTKAMLWSDQDGPNLRGVNVTITPRDVRIDGGNIKPKRMYNGKSDVTQAFIDALTNGSVSSSGFTAEDRASGSVALDFTSGSFKAWTVNDSNNPDKNVGIEKNVKFSGTIGFSGSDAGNYTFDGSSLSSLTGKATITKAPLYLKIGKTKAADKTYDGTPTVVDTDMLQTKPNISLDKSKTAPTIAQMGLGQTIQDGAIMRDDNDAVDSVDFTVGGPKYTNDAGVEQIHVGNHKLQYTGAALTGADAGNYELYYTPASGTKTAVEGGNVYLDGKIVQREILRNAFDVYKTVTDPITHVTTQVKVGATKVYDGNSAYTPTSGTYLTSNAPASGDTGIVSRDQGHITFRLAGDAYFTNNAGAKTKNVAEATKVAYTAQGQADSHTDTYGGHLLSDYYVLNEDGVTKNPLDDIFSASGEGKITPKTITAAVKENPITKVYDALRAHDKTGDDIITLRGLVSGDSVTNTSTAEYDNKNVGTNKNVTYTAKFSIANTAEAQNYTFSPQATPASATQITTTTTLTGLGTITPRPITMSFASVSKVYDGTATNTDLSSPTLDDGAGGVVLQRDFGTSGPTLTGHITSRYGDRTTSFTENPNAGSRSVEYVGFQNTLGTNYTVADKQYGTGTITRRRIDPSSFNVYKRSDNTPATITKVYDGTSTYNVGSDVYLSANTAPNGDTGIVSRDFQKVTFALAPSTQAHFTSDAAGQNVTSHVRDAHYAAYDIVAATTDRTNHPLSNYTYGSVGNTQNLESLHNARATAAGASITPASLTATPQPLNKVYDGMTEHTNGDQKIITGDRIVRFTGFKGSDAAKFTNQSTASYGKDVVLGADGKPTRKSATYTMQLSGANVDDYRILHPNNASQQGTLTNGGDTLAFSWNVANAALVKPRPVTVNFADARKTYDGTDENTSITASSLNDGLNGRVFQKDGISSASFTPNSGIQSRYVDKDTHGSYVSAYNAGAHEVEYTGIQGSLGNNYEVQSTSYGKGTIDRRRLSPTGITVRNADGTVATAEKVYDGKSAHTAAAAGTYLDIPASGANGVAARDVGKVRLVLRQGAAGCFTSDAAGEKRTSHVSQAHYIAYDAVADTTDPRNHPLTNYTFGADDATARNLESVNAAAPFHATAAGKITPREITVQTSKISKIYDGSAVHTDNNRNPIVGDDSVLKFVGLVDDETSARPVNTSTATYVTAAGIADANVAYTAGKVTEKHVKYTAKLTGTYADDYKIAGATNTVTTVAGVKTITAELAPVANAGRITPRALTLTPDRVDKTYDTDSTNSEVRGITITDPRSSSAIADILDGDHIKGTVLKNTLQGMLTAKTAASTYGHLSNGKFDPDPLASNGIDHDVQYTNVKTAFRNAFGAQAAGNYTVADTVYGKGEIKKAQINASDVRFKTSGAHKIYDGTTNVLWKDPATGTYYADQAHVSKYITEAKVTLNGKEINLLERGDITLDVDKTKYRSADATNGTPGTVDYHLYLKDRNIVVSGDNKFYSQDTGTIDRRTLTLALAEKEKIDKLYDGESSLVDKDKRHYTAFEGHDNLGNVRYAAGTTAATKLVNNGAQVSVTAAYADKNVAYADGKPAEQDITYTVRIAGDAGKNYMLSDGTTTRNAEVGLDTLKAKGTISPRALTMHFKEPVHKDYDGSTENTEIRLRAANPVTADDSDGRAALAMREVTSSDFTLTNAVKSDYGYSDENGKFTPDENAGPKDVEYRNLAGLLPAKYRGNYTLEDKSYGSGTIGRTKINADDVKFVTKDAHKIYDGTKDVLWKKADGTYSGALEDVRNYITDVHVTVNGRKVVLNNNVQLDKNNKPQYKSPDVADATGENITYTFSLDTKNFDIIGTNSFTKKGKGTMSPRDLSTQMPEHIYKEYDGAQTFTQRNTAYAEAIAREHLMPLADRDKPYLELNVLGTYHSPNATVDTKADAQVKNANSTTVDYQLTLGTVATADQTVAAKRLQNYKNIGPVNGKSGDIYRKELTVSVDALPDKIYDGKRTIAHSSAALNEDRIHYAGFVNGEGTGFKLSADGLKKVRGTYDTADVSRDAHGNPTHKAITYTGLNDALRAMTGTEADNYRVALKKQANYNADDDKLSYVPGDKKGLILPRSITNNDILSGLSFTEATKIYDGTDVVKHNEDASAAALHNYIEHAYVMDGGKALTDDDGKKIDIKDALTIDPKRTHYADKNVHGETLQGVTYRLDYTPTTVNNNFTITGGALDYRDAQGKILRREVTAHVKSPLTKEYDALRDVVGVAKNSDGKKVETGDDLIRFDNLTGNDGVKNLSTATYAVTDAGKGVRVDYDARLDSDNYRIVKVEDLYQGKNEITKRRLNLSFDHVDKEYDTTAANRDITARLADSDAAHRADTLATLTRDGMAATTDADGRDRFAQFTATNTTSHYGHRHGDKFDTDPNAAKTDRDVRYQGIGEVFRSSLGNHAKNYEFAEEGWGRGRIDPAQVTRADFTLKFAPTRKVYDGTDALTGNARDLLTVKLRGNAIPETDIRSVAGKYRGRDAGDHIVDYTVTLNGGNYAFTDGTANPLTDTGSGRIDRRTLTLALAEDRNIDKIYDGESSLVDKDKRHYTAFEGHDSLGNVRYAAGTKYRLVDGDGAHVSVAASYADENAAKDKQITYTVRIDENKGGKNYLLSDGTHPAVEAESAAGLQLSAKGTIARRKLSLNFRNPVPKIYDKSEQNKDITLAPNYVTPVDSDPRAALALKKDRINEKSFDLTGVESFYGTRTAGGFTPNADVLRDANGNVITNGKDVQYKNLAGALAGKSYANNYEIMDESYAKGWIKPLIVDGSKVQYDIDPATKTYDGTNAVKYNGSADPGTVRNYLRGAWVDLGNGQRESILDQITVRGASYASPDVLGGAEQKVSYDLAYKNGNVELKDGTRLNPQNTVGTISKRRLSAALPNLAPTKTYDRTNDVVGKALTADGGRMISTQADLDRHMRLGIYDPKDGTESIVERDRARITPHLFAQFRDKDVAWSGDAVANKPVDYTYVLNGAGVENYDIVDGNGRSIAVLGQDTAGQTQLRSREQALVGAGRINPYEITLTPKNKTVSMNDGAPPKYGYEGEPMGKGYRTPLGETLTGEIRYGGPELQWNQMRWRDYDITGEYVPDGRGDIVYRNYRFITPKGTLHVTPYIPDYEYYKALAQTSKMLPDEYAYENASLARRSHFGRDSTAEIAYMPPSINMVKDGVDISKTDIRITDETVFSLVNEVFG